MGLKGPDVILIAPASELEPGGLYAPNREGVAAAAKRRRRRVIEDELAGTADYHRYLVRTAIIRSDKWHRGETTVIASSKDVADMARHLANADQEHMVVFATNAKNELQAIHEAAVGGTSSITLELQHLVKIVMLTSSRYAFMVHNHPSGIPQPSPEDWRTTVAAYAGLGCVGAILVDHVIIAARGYYSFRDTDNEADWRHIERGEIPPHAR